MHDDIIVIELSAASSSKAHHAPYLPFKAIVVSKVGYNTAEFYRYLLFSSAGSQLKQHKIRMGFHRFRLQFSPFTACCRPLLRFLFLFLFLSRQYSSNHRFSVHFQLLRREGDHGRETARDPSYHERARNSAINPVQEEPLCFTGKWYFTREEIEDNSPSRRDGISTKRSRNSRKLYCSYLQELAWSSKCPRTIATAMLFLSSFYMRQSHAKNYWQTIATASMFFASKAEETPRWLSDLVVVAYKLANKWDPLLHKELDRGYYDKQKETVVLGERLLLLHFVTLCLQYKPHYIAAGSLFLAAKLQKVKLPHNKRKMCGGCNLMFHQNN
nr:cyclin-T1-4-like [Coffea arabica]